MSTSLFSPPALGFNTIQTRPYQDDALDAARAKLTKDRSTCILLPTGTGKTVVFASAARKCVERGGRVLILAHREELVHQAANMVERAGVLPGIERAESHARSSHDPDVVIGMVQTLCRPKRLESWPRDHFRLIVVDEAHHATADSYRRILKHFAPAKVLGVTATPDRSDGDELASVFQSVAYEMSIWDAMTAPEPGPYLCRLKVMRCETGVDLRGIRTTGGDFNLGDLEERITPMIDLLANAIREKAGDRQTLVFTPDCGSAAAMATALQSLGLNADFVWGDSPDRVQKVRDYKAGVTQFLCNCQIFTEGFDAPDTAAIALCRPTKSRSLYSQMVGRGTRLAPGKDDCLLIDFAWLTDTMDLVRPSDLFDRTTRNDEEGEILADMIAKAPEGLDLVEATREAKEEASKRQVLRIKARSRDVKVRWVSYDPLAMADVLGIPMRGKLGPTSDPATPSQVQTLAKFGVEKADQMSRSRASRMLDVVISRAKAKLATPKQVSWAIRMGMDADEARAMSFQAASAYLDAAFKGGRKTG